MNKEKGFVTIGMPVYNGEKFIRAAIQSFLQQTYRNFELIIVDDRLVTASDNDCELGALRPVSIVF